jgi:tRNA (adenine22-N1)-methyltransferase
MKEDKTATTLSLRLNKIADQVPTGSIVADIGTDHALLPTYLVKHGICPKVIAGEYNEGPFIAAQEQVSREGLTDQIDVRRGDGLGVLQPGEASVITISGMGGALIADILQKGPEVIAQLERLVLQPNVGEDLLRKWLKDNGWRMTAEYIVEEDGKIYEVLTADKGESDDLYSHPSLSADWLLRLGPHLVRERNPLLLKKWGSEYQKITKIIQQVGQSDTEEARLKLKTISSYAKELEGILSWLQTETPSSKL